MNAKTVRSFSVPINVGLFSVSCSVNAEAVGVVPEVFGVHAALVMEYPHGDRGGRSHKREFRVVRDGDPVRGGRYIGSFTTRGGRELGHVYEVG